MKHENVDNCVGETFKFQHKHKIIRSYWKISLHILVSPAILSPYLATIARERASTNPAGMNLPELANLKI